MDSIRVLVVDDHPSVRRGLRSLLSSHRDILVVGEAADGTSACQAAVELSPDVILLDIQLPGPNGVQLIRPIRQRVPHAKIIILTAHDHEEYVCEALRAGIHAYLLKSSSDETLVETVRSVHCGKRYLSPSLVDKVLREFELLSRSHTLRRTDFSEQELQLLELVSRGLNTREISKRVYLSERTIKRRMDEVKDKLGARTRAQAVAEAIRRGLI